MKNLTKITLLTIGLAALSGSAFAADTAAPADSTAPAAKHRHHARVAAIRQHRAELRKHVAKKLDLTDAQKEQLKAKRAELKTALQSIRNDSTLSKEQKHAKARELVASARTNFRSVLTPEQQAKLDQARDRMAKHRKRAR
jgi:Spy/CpxP family protein refolding chaperone